PERVLAELQDVVERHGIRKIYFRDATFTLDQKRAARLCALIREAGWRLEWMCETRVDCLGDALLEQMAAAGCVGMLVGIETGDEAVMHHKEGKKGLTVPKLAHLRRRARELGIRLHFLLIAGLPHETRSSIVDTYDLVMRHDPDTIGLTVITPYPGTPLPAAHEVPLTVVIPTYNRRDILKKTLLAFSAQTVAPAEFEVVVVDDGSTDDTLAMLAALRTPFALRVLAEPHRGPNAARNRGI